MTKLIGQGNLFVSGAILILVTMACSLGDKASPKSGSPGVDIGIAKSSPTLTPGSSAVTTASPTPTRAPAAIEGRWVLDSVTAVPESKSGWTYNAQSTSAHEDVYNGDKHDYQWTKPPTQIDMTGFTITFSTQCQSQPNNVCESLIGASGTGLDTTASSNDRKAEANGENGSIGRGENSVTFKPSPDAKDLQLEVGLGWSDIKFIYKYRRAS